MVCEYNQSTKKVEGMLVALNTIVNIDVIIINNSYLPPNLYAQ